MSIPEGLKFPGKGQMGAQREDVLLRAVVGMPKLKSRASIGGSYKVSH
jgi:hypothetical protein